MWWNWWVMEFSAALSLIRKIPDFPKTGIIFQDITPVLSNAGAFAVVISEMSKSVDGIDLVAGIEARGFILAAALASHSNKGFVPFRKSGKLPFTTYGKKYGLEYGDDEIEVHVDAFRDGQSVLIVDDVLATGGTLLAAIALAHRCGAVVDKVLVLLEIDFLDGRSKIIERYPDIEVIALAHV
jgi:adenine phosphoribosyltransferase